MKNMIIAVLGIFCVFFISLGANYGYACTGPGCSEQTTGQITIDAVAEAHVIKAYGDPTTNLVMQDMILKLSGFPCAAPNFEAAVTASHYASNDASQPELKQGYTDQRQKWHATFPAGLKFQFQGSGKTGTEVSNGDGASGARGLSLSVFDVTARDLCTNCGPTKSYNGEIFSGNGITTWFEKYSNIADGGQTETVNTGVTGNFTFTGTVNAPNPQYKVTNTLDLTAHALAENNYGWVSALVKALYEGVTTSNCQVLNNSRALTVNSFAGANNLSYTAKISGSVTSPVP